MKMILLSIMTITTIVCANTSITKKVNVDKKQNTSKTKDIENVNKRLDLFMKKFEKAANKKIAKDKMRKSIVKTTNMSKAMLPEPFKSVMIGNYVAVYAHVKVVSLMDNAKPVDIKQKNSFSRDLGMPNVHLPSRNIRNNEPNNIDTSINDLKYTTKDIRLYVGSEFNGWLVKRLTLRYVIFENPETKEIVKKYY